MKKLLLSIFMAVPFLGVGQVVNPEKSRTLLVATGWTVTATSAQDAVAGASKIIDGSPDTYWESNYGGGIGPTTPVGASLTVDMQTSKVIDGILVSKRLADYAPNFLTGFTIETSPDNSVWTTQATATGLSSCISNAGYAANFASQVTCRYYKITVNTTNGGTGNIAEVRPYTNATLNGDKFYNRSTWAASSTNYYDGNQPGGAVDGSYGSFNTFWGVKWAAGTTQAFPHELVIDMGSSLKLNEVAYVQRSTARGVTAGNLIFSNASDFSTIIATIPFTWSGTAISAPTVFALGQTVNARYVKISATANSDANALGSTCLSEFYAGYDITLPVTLTDFTAKANGSQVNLTWKTSSEQNSDYFQVLRLADGVAIGGQIKAAGNSNSEKVYYATDFSPLKGDNYYKLTQTDKDGTVNADAKWVATAKIAAPTTSLTVLSTTATSIEVNVYAAKATTGTLAVTNVTGQKVGSVSVKLTEGYNKYTVPANTGNGVVIVTLKTAEGTISKKAIK